MYKIILVLATALVVSQAAEVIPVRDSFEVITSLAFNSVHQLQAINACEEARSRHGTDLPAVAEYVRDRFDTLFGYDHVCVAALQRPGFSYWYRNSYILLKSDTSDNMHIFCTKVARGNSLVSRL